MKSTSLVDQKDKSAFSITNFRLIAFQPDESFYKLNFEERLAVLTQKIQKAIEYVAHLENNQTLKILFVAPEYLFKFENAHALNNYCNKSQKNIYKETLKKLSTQSHILFAPGTIAWRSIDRNSSLPKYRNMIYFFQHGVTLSKYRKQYPHLSYDFDYMRDKDGYVTIDHRGKQFIRGVDGSNIKELDCTTFGIEICFDTICGSLQKTLSKDPTLKNKKLNVQLVVADGATKSGIIQQSDLLYIKIERTPHEFANRIGTVHDDPNNNFIQAEIIKKLDDDLITYKFAQLPPYIKDPHERMKIAGVDERFFYLVNFFKSSYLQSMLADELITLHQSSALCIDDLKFLEEIYRHNFSSLAPFILKFKECRTSSNPLLEFLSTTPNALPYVNLLVHHFLELHKSNLLDKEKMQLVARVILEYRDDINISHLLIQFSNAKLFSILMSKLSDIKSFDVIARNFNLVDKAELITPTNLLHCLTKPAEEMSEIIGKSIQPTPHNLQFFIELKNKPAGKKMPLPSNIRLTN